MSYEMKQQICGMPDPNSFTQQSYGMPDPNSFAQQSYGMPDPNSFAQQSFNQQVCGMPDPKSMNQQYSGAQETITINQQICGMPDPNYRQEYIPNQPSFNRSTVYQQEQRIMGGPGSFPMVSSGQQRIMGGPGSFPLVSGGQAQQIQVENLATESPRSVKLAIFDANITDWNKPVFQNTQNISNRLNSLGTNCNFNIEVNKRAYINEIPEACILVNDTHVLTNKDNFRIPRDVFLSEQEVDNVARFILRCLEVGCRYRF